MNNLTPLKAIKAKCIECCCGYALEVKNCVAKDCALFPFRFGKNPFSKKREYTEAQKEQMRSRLENAHKTWGK